MAEQDLRLKVLHEAGYEQALLGLALSYYREGYDVALWWTEERQAKAAKQLETLAFRGGGHNKALESIVVWFVCTAPRAFWQEFDTYRVGMTKNSASTMHTLTKELVTTENFTSGTRQVVIDNLNQLIQSNASVSEIKANLPEGYLQTRQVCCNYMVLQNIVKQRENHRLKYWNSFITSILEQSSHPELIKQEKSCKIS